ncbi:hypothetical protein PTNB73_08131 [Pyrenophora teres f. teres]|uniref:DUF3112 domain containing protein n=1 Tax=Pyrenophora teres f. teres (strain 0-1) TaxID=861557 RepID=E3RGA1_PYRTT|nr:hypothetical protein PTT_06802 [Pyrenophora teres f. teres 0-1]KAE8837227.1 hypothetical protein HRS9122_07382 [Pyrenophora teres f. teres]KAE8860521.1 hypothetical protein PTNB73_08131 [Pyrenophora teres f. teres]
MSSQQDAHGPPSGQSGQVGPPFAPRNAGLGGTPTIVPDVPVAIVFLLLYLLFGVIHIKIFKSNKHRGHKFIFNGAILGLCKIRIITMSLRIAWANYPRNVSLAITANVFVYVGTIILYMLNWFFVQRVVRSLHPHLGWSTAYRIVHRVGLGVLVVSLLMLVISQIWQFFTTDQAKLNAFHDMFVIAQTYFTILCAAPAIFVAISLIIPRKEVDPFGAGRLKNNITILLISVSILLIGQVFRCVLAWIPAIPMIDIQRGTVIMPWYLSKAAFYCFNFVTEIVVIIMFAIVRVDLRFYVPNGARRSGDYSRSRVNLHGSEKNVSAPSPMIHRHNGSNETLHNYPSSVFEDTQTLADSLRYPHSTLAVDERTGNWKVKRVSGDSSRSRHTTISFEGSSSRTTLAERSSRNLRNAPPVPGIPAEWPLPDDSPPRGTNRVLEHTNPASRRTTLLNQPYELSHHQLNSVDVGDAVTNALNNLEMNSEKRPLRTRKSQPYSPTPNWELIPTRPEKSHSRSPSRHSNTRQSLPQTMTPRTRANSTPAPRPPIIPQPSSDLPLRNPPSFQNPTIAKTPSPQLPMGSPSLEIISLLNRMSGDHSRYRDASLQRDQGSSSPESSDRSSYSGHFRHDKTEIPGSAAMPIRQSSSKYSSDDCAMTSGSSGSEQGDRTYAREAVGRLDAVSP